MNGQLESQEANPSIQQLSNAPTPNEMEFNRKFQKDMSLMQMKGAIIDLKRIKFDALTQMYKTMMDESLGFKITAKEQKDVKNDMKKLMMSLLEVVA